MIESMLETILFAALAVLVVAHLVAPLILRQTFRFSAKLHPRLLAPQEVTPEFEKHIESVAPALKDLGFENLGCYDFGEPAANTRTVLALFSNLNANDFANLTISCSSHLTESYLEFSAEFASGLRVETNNNGVLPLTPDPKLTRVFRFAEIRDPRELYRLHRQFIENHAPGAWVAPETKGQEISRWTRTMENYGPRHAALGYMKPASESGKYELTWKGAALMAWKGMLPTALVRQVLHHFAMSAELRSLEMRGVTRLQKA